MPPSGSSTQPHEARQAPANASGDPSLALPTPAVTVMTWLYTREFRSVAFLASLQMLIVPDVADPRNATAIRSPPLVVVDVSAISTDTAIAPKSDWTIAP